MDFTALRQIESLYKKSEQLLATGEFGQGLWPVDPEVGQFLHWLITFFDRQRGLEVGAGVGFSTAWLSTAFMKTGGKLLSFEYFPPKIAQWETFMKKLHDDQCDNTVQLVPSDIMKWKKHSGLQRYDFVFFDQRKGDYLPHLQALLPKLRKGAFICADNVTSHAVACQDYLKFVKGQPEFASATLEMGAGLEVTRYLP